MPPPLTNGAQNIPHEERMQFVFPKPGGSDLGVQSHWLKALSNVLQNKNLLNDIIYTNESAKDYFTYGMGTQKETFYMEWEHPLRTRKETFFMRWVRVPSTEEETRMTATFISMTQTSTTILQCWIQHQSGKYLAHSHLPFLQLICHAAGTFLSVFGAASENYSEPAHNRIPEHIISPAPAPGSAPGANRTPSGFTATQKPCPGSRPLLGTEQCHGGDNGLCLAGCEDIRCAGSTVAESSLNEKK